MKGLFEELKGILERGEAAVLVTIIASHGSTPRGTGSRMLVRKDGTIMGTVGGGAVEYRAMQAAQEAMKGKSSFARAFTLDRNQAADIGMVCGGDVVAYFQYVCPEDKDFAALCQDMAEALDRDEDSWMILDITDEAAWQAGLYSKGGGLKGLDGLGQARAMPPSVHETEPSSLLWRNLEEAMFGSLAHQAEVDGCRYYVEPLAQAGTVYIFGGGHVAQELVPVLSHVGFPCVVMDDREEFACPEVFPQASGTIVGDLQDIGSYLAIRPCDYVCIMTRGHQFDYYVQKQALEQKPCYIGIMGSRNKIRVVTEKLLSDGFTREEIGRCHTPIGTEIYAETPAEIAISIAGELIAMRAARAGRKKQGYKNI